MRLVLANVGDCVGVATSIWKRNGCWQNSDSFENVGNGIIITD
jgi:hypothetical protein